MVMSIKVRLLYYKIRNKASAIKLFCKNIYDVFFTAKSEARMFTGPFSKWLAVRYADKRAKISAVNKLCGGKRHYVVHYGADRLFVINKSEMNILKRKHIFRKNYNVLDVLENAFYITSNKVQG